MLSLKNSAEFSKIRGTDLFETRVERDVSLQDAKDSFWVTATPEKVK